MARALGIPERWGELKQVHGAAVHKLDNGFRDFDPGAWLEADALLVRGADAPVAVFAADCLPVALVSPELAGVAHAGWRGLAAGILDFAVGGFTGEGSVTAWIGPSIGPCHYQVGGEVVEAFQGAYPAAPEFWEVDGDRFRFDLRAAARWVLRRAGATVPEYDPPCTYCDDRFYSYRRDGGVTGRQAVVVWR